MSLAVISDLHITDNPNDQYRMKLIEALPRILTSRDKPFDALLINGDLTEAKDRHSAKLVNAIVDAIAAIAAKLPVLINTGNHDYANEGHPFFAFLSHVPDVLFVNTPTWGDDLPKPFNRIFAGDIILPHTRNPDEDWRVIRDTWDDAYRIFAHNTFSGAKTNAGMELNGGIPIADLPTTPHWYVGDVHVPQRVGCVEYIGAPYTVDYGDSYLPRMIVCDRKGHHDIDLSEYPQKVLLDLASIDDLEKQAKRQNVAAGDLVKVRVAVDDMRLWPEIRNTIDTWADNTGVQVRKEPKVIRKSVKRRHAVIAQGTSKQDDTELLIAFGRRHQLEDWQMQAGFAIVDGAGGNVR